MKTETAPAPNGAEAKNNGAAAAGSQPGNQSVRQLAASLSKTAPSGTANSDEAAAGEAAESAEPKKGAKGSSREPNAKGKRAPKAATEQENTETAEETGEESTAEIAENAETENTGEETQQEGAEESQEAGASEETAESQEEATEGNEGNKGQKPELPEELSQAIEDAKASGEEGKAKLLKRLHRLVDERDTHRNQRLAAEEQNRQLTSRMEELQKGGQAQGAVGQSGQHPEVAKVAQELANVDHWRNWCAENSDGGEVPDGKGGKIQLDAAAVKQLGRRLDDQRDEVVARKVHTERQVEAAWNQAYAQHHAEASEQYPWLKNQNSPEHQEMQAILKAFPAIKASPDYEKVLAWMFRGRAAEQAEAKAKAAGSFRTGTNGNGNGAPLKKAAASREPTKVPTSPPGGTTNGKKSDLKTADAEKEFKSSGSTQSLAKLFAARGRAVSK